MIDNLVVDPYHGGSHAYVSALVARFLPGKTELLTMPSRLFKWRMGTAALRFAQRIHDEAWRPKRLVTTDMLDLSRLKGLAPKALSETRSALIMHENQLSYPRQDGDREDLHLGLINLYSAWCADLIWWNSSHHRDLFLDQAEALLKLFPKRVPKDLHRRLIERSQVFGLPMDLDELEPFRREAKQERPPGPLRIAWNHRMAYDKNPELIFGRLARLAQQGLHFEVHRFGPRHQPPPQSLEAIKDRCIDHGFLARPEYLAALANCDVVVADPGQEHFGLSVAEAVQLGLWPVVPKRLCYPELLPATCLFEGEAGFEAAIRRCAEQPGRRAERHYARFEASLIVARLCAALDSV